MSCIAIITARGGSKRIPRKNIKDFLGKPIIAYSIETALASKLFDEVMVSTDDPEITQIAQKYGAKVPFQRSQKASDDFATTAEVINEVLDTYQQLGRGFSTACCIYPTAPFISTELLQQASKILKRGSFRYRFSSRTIFIPHSTVLSSDPRKQIYPTRAAIY